MSRSGIHFQNMDYFIGKLERLEADMDDALKQTVNRMVNEGMAVTKEETPVGKYETDVFIMTQSGKQVHFKRKHTPQGGTLKSRWKAVKARKKMNGYVGSYTNNVYYGLYVNYGHRIVRKGVTIGYATGFFMLEAGIQHAKEHYQQYFNEEINKVKQKGGWQ